MAPSRTSTVKSKHATNKSGIRNSKTSTRAPSDGVSKSKAPKHGKGTTPLKGKSGAASRANSSTGAAKKKKVYTAKELGIPNLNMITPVGVEKPKGKKKGKVFVDDKESMLTILAMVNADKEGQIESKMMKARQMEEIREARKAEAEKRMEMRKTKLEDTKDSIRKKRKRASATGDEEKENVSKADTATGTRSGKPKRKSVSFA